jgi:hypothetical protein
MRMYTRVAGRMSSVVAAGGDAGGQAKVPAPSSELTAYGGQCGGTAPGVRAVLRSVRVPSGFL